MKLRLIKFTPDLLSLAQTWVTSLCHTCNSGGNFDRKHPPQSSQTHTQPMRAGPPPQISLPIFKQTDPTPTCPRFLLPSPPPPNIEERDKYPKRPPNNRLKVTHGALSQEQGGGHRTYGGLVLETVPSATACDLSCMLVFFQNFSLGNNTVGSAIADLSSSTVRHQAVYQILTKLPHFSDSSSCAFF